MLLSGLLLKFASVLVMTMASAMTVAIAMLMPMLKMDNNGNLRLERDVN